MAIDRAKYLNIDEIRQLRAFSEGNALIDLKKGRKAGVLQWMVVDFALSTGLRVSEMASINIDDIDFKRGSITVSRLKRKKQHKETLAIGKELSQHIHDFLEGRETGRLFVGKRGNLTAQGLQRIWKAAIKKAGLPTELSIHSARHTIAVHLLKKSGNLRLVQKQLGHASPATTANMYADISFEDMQENLSGLY